MKHARALIFDLYGTLLQVGPPPPDAEARWAALWGEYFPPAHPLHAPPLLTLAELEAAVAPLIAREHALARARTPGLRQPEIIWPDLAAQVLPALPSLAAPSAAAAGRDAFFVRHAALCRTVSLAPGAADCVRRELALGTVLGIASNAQAVTRHELAAALGAHGLSTDLFAPELCFFSYEHGVAKPDPAVFAWLSARLAAQGVPPGQTLMIGDREDNDVAPARAAGWLAWQLAAEPGEARGDWAALTAARQGAAGFD
jgi:FMN phosphatase YigB (HAD superfamily)